MMTTPERFEDRLLLELRQIVDARPAPTSVESHRPLRRRVALGAVGVVAATVVVAIVATSGDVTPSAYAVQSRADGAVTVSIHSLADATGLQSSLRAAGVPAVVDYASSGQTSCLSVTAGSSGAQAGTQEQTGSGDTGGTSTAVGSGATTVTAGHAAAAPGAPLGAVSAAVASKVEVGSDGVRFTIDPSSIKPGQIVYITTSTGAVDSIGMSVGTTAAGVPCPPKP
jgi:hypothetical protein